MATTEELFISIAPQIYRQNKSSVLMSQADILQSLKHLQNISVLSRQKNDLKTKFQKLLTSTIAQVNSIQKKIPTPNIPIKISKQEAPKPKIKLAPKPKVVFSKKDKIEEELKLIQNKLQELNA